MWEYDLVLCFSSSGGVSTRRARRWTDAGGDGDGGWGLNNTRQVELHVDTTPMWMLMGCDV